MPLTRLNDDYLERDGVNTHFAMSRPMVVTVCMLSSSESGLP
jgi:hypothetical protein